MSGIDKKACRQFLEPGLAPNSDCGLFLVHTIFHECNAVLNGGIKLLLLNLNQMVKERDKFFNYFGKCGKIIHTQYVLL